MCIDTGIVFFYGIPDSTTQFFNRNAGVRNQGRKQHPTGKTFHRLQTVVFPLFMTQENSHLSSVWICVISI
jgi:hypothetical protein